MPSKRFQGLRTALRGFLGDYEALLPAASEVKAPLKAKMTVEVKRFQGIYECGCAALPLDGVDRCPAHDYPKKYVLELVEERPAEIHEGD